MRFLQAAGWTLLIGIAAYALSGFFPQPRVAFFLVAVPLVIAVMRWRGRRIDGTAWVLILFLGPIGWFFSLTRK